MSYKKSYPRGSAFPTLRRSSGRSKAKSVKAVKAIAKAVIKQQAEKKWATYNFSDFQSNITTSGVSKNLTALITEGDGHEQRSGDVIRYQRMKGRVFLRYVPDGNNSNNAVLRFIVATINPADAANINGIGVSDVIDTRSITNEMDNPVRVLYDRTLIFNASSATSADATPTTKQPPPITKLLSYNINLRNTLQRYDADANEIGKELRIYMVSNIAANETPLVAEGENLLLWTDV